LELYYLFYLYYKGALLFLDNEIIGPSIFKKNGRSESKHDGALISVTLLHRSRLERPSKF
jgi:hypothetical protein